MVDRILGGALNRIAEGIFKWAGFQTPAQLIFGAGQSLVAGTFSPAEWDALTRWYRIFFSVGMSGLMIYAIVLVIGLKSVMSSADPADRASAMQSVWDTVTAALFAVLALPALHGLLSLNWALVNAVSDWMGSGGMTWAQQLDQGFLTQLVIPGETFWTGVARLVYAGVCLQLNFLYLVRKFVLVVSVVLIPLFCWAWAFRGTRLPVLLLGTEILSNSFMSFSHAVVMAIMWSLFYGKEPAPGAGMTSGLAQALGQGVGVLVSASGLAAAVALAVNGYRLMTAVDPHARAQAMTGIRRWLVAAVLLFGAWAVQRVIFEVVVLR